MPCKLCGTHLPDGQLTCPNCGHVMTPGREGERVKEMETDAPRGAAPPLELDTIEVEGAAGPEGGVRLEEKADRPKTTQTGEAPIPVFALDPAGLRRLLGLQPELLEPGLSVFTDEKGRAVGVGYSTRVGDIDLLARDKSGAFVVVRVAGEREGGEELVAETLQRIGWVRKHLGKGKQKTRGIVLVEQVPENLSYTAAGVAETITFKTFRLAVTFEDVEIS